MSKFISRFTSLILLIFSLLGALAIYFCAVNLINLIPLKSLEIEVNYIQVLFSFILYFVFIYDYLKLIGRYFEAYSSASSRFWLQSGTVLGSAIFKIGMMVIWYFLMQTTFGIILSIVYASILTIKVARLRLDDLQDTSFFKQLKQNIGFFLIPLDKFFNKISSSTVHSPSLLIKNNLTQKELFFTALLIPISTIHDFVGFIAFHKNFDILSFGIGIILANFIVNILLGFDFFNIKIAQIFKNNWFIIFSVIFFLSLIILNFISMFIYLF